MKKRWLALLLSALLLFSLVSCGQKGEVEIPDGMQLAAGGTDLGYYFFVPEEWTVSNLGNVSAAYVSPLTPASVSLSATELADGESAADYFEKSFASFPEGFGLTKVEEGTACTLGNAEDAVSYVYTYTYQEKSFRTLQILAKFEGRAYLYTYTAPDTKADGAEKTPYETYAEKARSVVSAIKFIEKEDKTPEEKHYETDADGYLLVSDGVVTGFDFYLAPAFTPTLTTGIIGAVAEDGASVTMSEATRTGVSVADYFKERCEELSAFVTELTVLRENEEITFANAKRARAYEYTYRLDGEVYHVYQVLSVASLKGFVFTYTEKDADYPSHLDEVTKMTEKIHIR
ncbi:MAG TPA: hypothetical protein DDY70_00200 [Clostridiales bacterium]|nr:hypothetical protein [Clostridiales bacterium]